MIDENFYELLEQIIGDALENSDNEEARHLRHNVVILEPGYRVEKLAKPLVWMRLYLGDRLFDRVITIQMK